LHQHVEEAPLEDADLLIAQEAIAASQSKDTVLVDDTKVLVLRFTMQIQIKIQIQIKPKSKEELGPAVRSSLSFVYAVSCLLCMRQRQGFMASQSK